MIVMLHMIQIPIFRQLEVLSCERRGDVLTVVVDATIQITTNTFEVDTTTAVT